ncbi:hypothetical protein ACO229_06435 [Promicromonospora sp. MS192]|uniref:hypothetical protein n=1 Tax=Promicromonospora sp. MS192 TaxID=3412684 RepID=UPI003C3082AD
MKRQERSDEPHDDQLTLAGRAHPEHVLGRVLPEPDGSTRLVPAADRTRLGHRMQEAFTRIGGAATQRGLTAPGFLRPPEQPSPGVPRRVGHGTHPGASTDLYL